MRVKNNYLILDAMAGELMDRGSCAAVAIAMAMIGAGVALATANAAHGTASLQAGAARRSDCVG